MASQSYPGPSDRGANAPEHRAGQDVNTVDQVSSVVLLGLALLGAAFSLVLVHFVPG